MSGRRSGTGRRARVRVVVDLNRCQGYAQCVFLAPEVFTLHGEEALLYDGAPDGAQRDQVLRGRMPPGHAALPARREVDADWRLGVRATGLDLTAQRVHLADGDALGFDRVLIATGVRARPWPDPQQAALDGVFMLRTTGD